MNDAEKLIDLLLTYYNVTSVSQLADVIDIGQPALSKWKKNNSVGAIKKKCRELGIYNEIFGDINKEIGDVLVESAADNNDSLRLYRVALATIGDDLALRESFEAHIKTWIRENV
ncbi:MAG: hypothetical protein QG567_194 [Campylobacterota bacterium]|nr:hypothetical protein [Campylobacterota bacterium]